jgi:hypothetical protein
MVGMAITTYYTAWDDIYDFVETHHAGMVCHFAKDDPFRLTQPGT